MIHNMKLVTNNLAHFGNTNGLEIDNWKTKV